MSDVTLRNPGLPADQWIRVSQASMAHYARSGWQAVPEAVVAARAQAEADARAKAMAAMTAPLAEPDGDAPTAELAVDAATEDPAAAPAVDAATDAVPESPAADAPKKRSR